VGADTLEVCVPLRRCHVAPRRQVLHDLGGALDIRYTVPICRRWVDALDEHKYKRRRERGVKIEEAKVR
jgi:hypothetical protein